MYTILLSQPNNLHSLYLSSLKTAEPAWGTGRIQLQPLDLPRP